MAETAGAQVTRGDDQTSFSYGRASIRDLDLPALARLYETRAIAGPNPLVKIHGEFSIENLDLVDGRDGGQFRIARISGQRFHGAHDFGIVVRGDGSVRRTRRQGRSDGRRAEPPRRDRHRLPRRLRYRFRRGDRVGHEGRVPPTSRRPRRRFPAWPIRPRRRPSPPDARLEGLEVTDQNGRFSLAGTSLTGFSFAPTLEGLKKMQGKSLDESGRRRRTRPRADAWNARNCRGSTSMPLRAATATG